MGNTLRLTLADGGTTEAYFAPAEAADRPGVVVLQEWWGLQDQIRGICDRFAAAGFNALAPDLYAGQVVPYHDTDGAAAAMQSLDFIGTADGPVAAAVAHLAGFAPKVGLTGFCMGGALTVLAATRVAGVDAAVAFYGLPPLEAAPPESLKVPFSGHFATRDDWCTPEVVGAFQARLTEASSPNAIHWYEGDHAFMNEQRPDVYDAELAELAWRRAVAFFEEQLAG